MRLVRITIVAAASSMLLGAACGTTSTAPAVNLDLDRPVDISFACFGQLRLTGGGRPGTKDDGIFAAAGPLALCDQWSAWDASFDPAHVLPNNGGLDPAFHNPALQPLGQEDLSPDGIRPIVQYYAFILQSVPGTVAIAHFPTKEPAVAPGKTALASGDVQLQDVDQLTPGASSISIGDLPVGIATDRNGCYEITANAGTCDLSTLDVASALDDTRHAIVNRLDVTNAAGQPVLARPAAIAAEAPGGTIGGYADPQNPGQLIACPRTPEGILYIAYPECHAIAAVDVSTGKIQASIGVDGAGAIVVDHTGALSCPAECGQGTPTTPGWRPTSLSLTYDARVNTRRLAIGSPDSNVVHVVDLGPDYLPTNTSTSVALDQTDGAIGINRLALSPQIGMGGDTCLTSDDGSDGGATGGQFQFVYAVATDGTVRVADVLTENNECETQADPRFLTDVTDVHYLSCMPVGDPRNPPRRAGARGPGIRPPFNDRAIAVTFVHALPTVPSCPAASSPPDWYGYFAVVSSAAGEVYIVNVDDDDYPDTDDPTKPLSRWLGLALPHQFRDPVPDRSTLSEETITNPDMSTSVVPVCNLTGTKVPGVAVADQADGPHLFPQNGKQVQQATSLAFIASEKLAELPSIHQVLCQGNDQNVPTSMLAFSAPKDVRRLAFPDLQATHNDETWTMTWEGPLSNDSTLQMIDGSIVREGVVSVDATGMHVSEGTHPYCGAGVEKYDEVVLRGCDVNNGGVCGIGNTCYVDPNATSTAGTCLPTELVNSLGPVCHEFLTSQRKYAAVEVDSGSLKLVPRRHVLRTTPIDGCTPQTDCRALELAEASLPATGPTGQPNAAEGSCKEDKDCGGTQTCDVATGTCLHAWSCEQDPSRFDAGGPAQCVMTCTTDDDCALGSVCDGGRCVDGVIPPAQCVPTLQRYELHGSESFVVIGQLTGYQHPIIEDKTTGACIRDPKASPLLTGRIPLRAPMCLGDGLDALSPNPCSTTVDQTELQTVYTFDPINHTCTAQSDQQLVTRKAQAIRFRNPQMTFELVDPSYPGDGQCIGDRMGTLSGIPIVFPGYQLQMRIVSGFQPYVVGPREIAYPINVVRGPLESMWIIDEGDVLSATSASSRGRVYRFESTNPITYNVVPQ